MLSEAQRERRRHIKRKLLQRRGYQFGQPADTCNLASKFVPGDMACADTSIQLLKFLVDGKKISINAVRRASHDTFHTPMDIINADIALRNLGLPYTRTNSLTASEIWEILLKRGPVMVAEDYWAHPQWRGYVYAGRRMNGRGGLTGKYVGFADPDRKAGSNQWNFLDGHMVLFAFAAGDYGNKGIGLRDPNHNSAVRPERPAWDRVSIPQANRMLQSFNGGTKQIWIPTEVVVR